MARPREFDTDVAIAQIADVFWDSGFEATSITDLEDATGLARARLYAAFGTKRDMLHLSIDNYLDGPLEMVFRRVDDGGLDAIEGWFQAIAQLREHQPQKAMMGCLVVNSLVELSDTDPEVNKRGDRYRARILHAFTSALDVAIERGETDGDSTQRANIAFMLLLGIFVSIKSGSDASTVKTLADAATSVIESWRTDDQDPHPTSS
ncbi:MAG: TetR/AcrR family transcriptional regulator [Acidimicrobiales bacterium]